MTLLLNNQKFVVISYLEGKPFLLKASSGNTNFIFKVEGLSIKDLDKINSINTRKKRQDRLAKII